MLPKLLTHTETVSGVVTDLLHHRGRCSFVVKIPEMHRVINVRSKDIIIGDTKSLKNGDFIRLTVDIRIDGKNNVTKYYVNLPDTNNNIEVEDAHKNKIDSDNEVIEKKLKEQKEKINNIWYVVVTFLVIIFANMLYDAGNTWLFYTISAIIWIFIIGCVGYFLYAVIRYIIKYH